MPNRLSDNSPRSPDPPRSPGRSPWSVTILLVGLLGSATAAQAQSDGDDTVRAEQRDDAPDAADARRLSLEKAIGLAMDKSDRIQDARANIRQAEATHRASTAQMGPQLRAESNVNRFDEPQTTEFSAPGQSGGAEVTVREQTTASLSLTAVQPLTPLWSLYEAQRIDEISRRQAEISLEETRRDVKLDVVEAYYRLLQARAVRTVAEQSLERRKQQLGRAEKFREAEQVPKNDVLRAEVGVSRARQQLIEAEGQIEVAGAQLARTIGISQNRPIVPTDGIEADYQPPPTVDAAVDRALDRRTALNRAELSIEQAQTGVRAARSRLLPRINALASYQRNIGSSFQNEASFFVGASLQWTFWQWGTKAHEIDQAKVQQTRARIGRRRLKRGLELEVRQAYSSYETSRQSLEVARRAAEQAEENFRAERQRYDAQLSTSIDLLEAETQLTETRTNVRNAEYEHHIAAATLRRAVGLSPSTFSSDNGSSSGD